MFKKQMSALIFFLYLYISIYIAFCIWNSKISQSFKILIMSFCTICTSNLNYVDTEVFKLT